MNKDETLELWAQGKDAWNAWAKEMLDQRTDTDVWMEGATADFARHVFTTRVDFRSFSFPHRTNFRDATFQHDASFDSAGFSADAEFDGATFSGIAEFDGARFSGTSGFSDATFSGRARFRRAKFCGDAMFGGATFGGIAEFSKATFDAEAGFACAGFDDDAELDNVTFGGRTWFSSATFSGDARFGNATFSRDSGFSRATFRDNAVFDSATFSGDALFVNSAFKGNALFPRATFSGSARFDAGAFDGYALFRHCCFDNDTNFAQAMFGGLADFTAAQGERGFSLEGVSFAEVPDFIQAHFTEAPRLDNVSVPEVGGIARFFLPVLPGIDANADTSARYRALKRLAIQAHDHTREMNYFASELKSLRGNQQKFLPCPLNLFHKDETGRRLRWWPGGLRGTTKFWFGLGYEALSNFGRSIVLPLLWWGLALVGFAFGYLDRHFERAAELGQGYAGGVGGWLWASLAQPLVERFPRLAELLPTPAAVASPACLVGPGEPWSAALGLSIRKALPFAGVGSTEKLNQIYACLYGELPARFTPVIPDAVDYLGIVQLLLSLLLLFLFLLAVRNHFRIR